MHFIFCHLLTAILFGADASSAEKPLFDDLLENGVLMSDDTRIKLPSPIISEGLDGEAQLAAIAGIAGLNHPVDELLRKSVVAPFEFTIRSAGTADGAPVRTVDVYFVAYGDWDVLCSKTFREELEKGRERKNSDSQFVKFTRLSQEKLAKRKIESRAVPQREEQYHFVTLILFDKVEVSATAYSQFIRNTESFVLAGYINPRFDNDPEYPNNWRSIIEDLDDTDQNTFGPSYPYRSFGFYSKATRLAKPEGAIFIEHHFVYEEPHGWFNGINLLRSKLPLILQTEVRDFRRKLAKASSDK